MQLKLEPHIFTGLQRDISVSKFDSNCLYDALNIRLTARFDDTLMSITNERGPEEVVNGDNTYDIPGKYLGHCVLDKYLVLFTTTSGEENNTESEDYKPDYIIRIDLSNLEKKVLANLKLGFSVDHKIETVGSYENGNVQKVYWTDGYNQPRVINIADLDKEYNSTSFDFIQELQLEEEIEVENIMGSGEFPSGVIQYAFTYYNKYLQETNIFYTTKPYCIAFSDRGASPEEKVSTSFKIKIKNPDPNFEYLRIYSILRTSLNATPLVKRLQDIKAIDPDDSQSITINDNKTNYCFIENSIDIKVFHNNEVQNIEWNGNLDITENGGFPNSTNGNVAWQDFIKNKNTETIYACMVTPPTNSNIILTLTIGEVKFAMKEYSSDAVIYLGKNTTTGQTIIICENYESSVNAQQNNDTLQEKTLIRYGESYTQATADYLSFIDTGTIGDDVDPTELLYKGGESILAKTMTDKDGTLFLGNIELNKKAVNALQESDDDKITVTDVLVDMPYRYYIKGDIPYINSIDSSGFKYNEYYRVGIQFQHKTGSWSEPKWVKDYQITNHPMIKLEDSDHYVKLPQIQVTLKQSNLPNNLQDYKRVRLLMAQPSHNDRTILCQGLTCPTFKTTNNKYNQSSWSFRTDGLTDFSILAEYSPNYKNIEIGATLDDADKFILDKSLITIHTPELIYDHSLYAFDFSKVKLQPIYNYHYGDILGDIDIQTSTPTIGSAAGFKKPSGTERIRTGLFYEDYIVDDINDTPKYGRKNNTTVWLWPVYLWHKTGSLNNDVIRENASAKLLKKKISNYIPWKNWTWNNNNLTTIDTKLFSNDYLSMIKVNGIAYMGNIDTSLKPKDTESKYLTEPNQTTKLIGRLWNKKEGTTYTPGLYKWSNNKWNIVDTPYDGIGNEVNDIVETSEPIRMTYKSTPHLVTKLSGNLNTLTLVDVYRYYNPTTIYGGITQDALEANLWIPISEPVALTSGDITITSNRGDTWYQMFECLKTYAFTPEDINQVVEIAAFPAESHVNLDGRYDRNRGQINNLNMSPTNFNLHNPVYSQLDNFFNYRILNEDFYKLNSFPNQITWTKEKHPGADVDLWTNITLASTYNLDGNKGEIVKLSTFSNTIFCFQKNGISNILFNSRVQIPTSDGIPVEITNSYKVDGYRYKADGIGCDIKDKDTIITTSSGIYFIENNSKKLYHIADKLSDITTSHNMSTWFKDNTISKILYDNINHDVYLSSGDKMLCYSEVLGQFISFYDYNNLDILESYDRTVFTVRKNKMYKMFKGEYNKLFRFDENNNNIVSPWYIQFISNGKDTKDMGVDKTFANIEYRMDIKDINGDYQANDTFDYIKVENEYQSTGEKDITSDNKIAQKKFRIWNISIPRNINREGDRRTFLDRIRNPWCKVTLGIKNPSEYKAELHDIIMKYYI